MDYPIATRRRERGLPVTRVEGLSPLINPRTLGRGLFCGILKELWRKTHREPALIVCQRRGRVGPCSRQVGLRTEDGLLRRDLPFLSSADCSYALLQSAVVTSNVYSVRLR